MCLYCTVTTELNVFKTNVLKESLNTRHYNDFLRGAIKMSTEKVGELAFLAGVVIAVLAALVTLDAAMLGNVTALLVVLGIVVGLLNVSEKETTPFLVAAIALVAAGTAGFGAVPTVGGYLTGIVSNLATFVAPAAVIVAVKAVYALASKK